MQKKQCLNIIRIILSIPFLVVGMLALPWGIVCLCGGPDGRIGSSESIGFGFGLLLFSILCGGLFCLLNRKKRWTLLTLGFLTEGVLSLFSLIFTASFFSSLAETDRWSMSLLIVMLCSWGISLAGGYGLFQLLRITKKSKR